MAIVSGLSRAARHGILIKGGKVLETMAARHPLVIDKTGTLTDGRARIVSVDVADGFSSSDVLRLAASLDQASKHIIAQTIVSEARAADFTSRSRRDHRNAGRRHRGPRGRPNLVVGRASLRCVEIANATALSPPEEKAPGAVIVAVAIDGKFAGAPDLGRRAASGSKRRAARLKALRYRTDRSRDRRPARRGGSHRGWALDRRGPLGA